MTAPRRPARLILDVSRKMRPFTKTATQLPPQYEQFRISGTQVQIKQAPFGCYFTQEITTKSWTISWLQLSIQSPLITLYGSADLPMIAYYAGIEGAVTWHLEGAGKVPLAPGTSGLYYIPAGTRNKIKFRRGNYGILHISLSPDFLDGFKNQHPQLQAFYSSEQDSIEAGKRISALKTGVQEMALFTQIRNGYHDGANREVYLDLLVRELLFLHLARSQKESKLLNFRSRTCVIRLQPVLDYIGANYYHPINVTDLAKKALMSRTGFIREFKRVYHDTPMAFLRNYRVEKAAALLIDTDLPICDIAEAVGFDRQGYFTAVFHKHFGVSPRVYRIRWKGSTDSDSS